jgi:hypothetical protein
VKFFSFTFFYLILLSCYAQNFKKCYAPEKIYKAKGYVDLVKYSKGDEPFEI